MVNPMDFVRKTFSRCSSRNGSPVAETTVGADDTANNDNVQPSVQPGQPPAVTVEEADDDELVIVNAGGEDAKTQYDGEETMLPDTAPLPPEQSIAPPDSVCFTKESLLAYHRRVDHLWKDLMTQGVQTHSPATFVPGQQNLPLRGMTGASDDPMKEIHQFMREHERAGDITRDSRGFDTGTGHKYGSWFRSPLNTAAQPGQPTKDELHPAYRPFLRDPVAQDPQVSHGTGGYKPYFNQYEKPYAVTVPNSEAGSRGAFGANTQVPNTQRSDQHQEPPQRSGSQTGPNTTTFQTAPTEQTRTGNAWTRTANQDPGLGSTAAPTGIPMPTSGPPVPQASSFNPQLDNRNVPQYPQQPPAGDPDPFTNTADGAPHPRFVESKDFTGQSGHPQYTSGDRQGTRDMPRPRPMPSSTQTGTGTYESRATYSTRGFNEEEEEAIRGGERIFETLEMVGLVPENAQTDISEAVSKILRYESRGRPNPTSYQTNDADTTAQIQYFASELLSLHNELFPSDVLGEDEKRNLNHNITDLLRSSHPFVPKTEKSPWGTVRGTGWRETELQVLDDLKKAAQQQAVREGRQIGLISMMRELPLVQKYNEEMSRLNAATSVITELRERALGGASYDYDPRSEADKLENSLINSLQPLKQRIGSAVKEIYTGHTFVQDTLRLLVDQRDDALAKGLQETARVKGDAINTIASLLTGTDFAPDAHPIKELDKIVELSNINLDRWHAALDLIAASNTRRQTVYDELHHQTMNALQSFNQHLPTLRRMRIEETANSRRGLANMEQNTARTIDFLASLGLHNVQDRSRIVESLASLVDTAMSQIERDRTGFTRDYADYVHHHSKSWEIKWSSNDDAPSRRYEPTQPYSQPQGPPVSTHGAYPPSLKPGFQGQGGTQVRDFGYSATNPTDTQPQGPSQDSTDDSERERRAAGPTGAPEHMANYLSGNGWT